ncbi:hypothetical protein ALQ08_103673 [Pseudomonas syringae pv. delphinii]|uniref:Uncharacterized protein n=1 Tax=Pseudomonas syringae pv. delphinii TaxID=192088 RepID=A0A0N8RGY4_9PSED|nr:hypothetical protein [Pseudomonas syringae group genomosp. 3]KPX27279.1 hypothetical protein ALO72_102977 [Pseudomonas syringae pv. delphinii]RMP17071.1 hypothetical protein ALQ27_103740 [Pseudomonas syringae pv. delphinii]RMP18056.1 hypothetical protein ALQ28_103484 [Pseudomonas syringae pv. delphinii]RMQ29737.1 hypothetical protein ALQ08_103673 [Pseudomonas syringae pv. delphinii]
MTEYRYTEAERIQQLQLLEQGLVALLHVSVQLGLAQTPYYQEALCQARFLMETGFTQTDLTRLSRSVPDAVSRGRDWESQYLIQKPDGSWGWPEWFLELESQLAPVMKSAETLRMLGYY